MRGKSFFLVRSAKANYFGFTLIELLVTVSILSILMTLALVSYGNLQKGARDAKRKADITTIQAMLEQYHADLGFYPTTITFDSALTNQTGVPAPTPSPAKTYMQKVPKETKTDQVAYSYAKKPDTCTNVLATPSTYCTNYCLYATVENTSNNVLASQCGTSVTNQFQVQAP
jgi:type II secretion system protein G